MSDHYIQLMIRPHHILTKSDFYDEADTDNFIIPGHSCPFISWLRNNQTTAHFIHFTEYIEYQIKQGYYLDACLDNFYLSCSEKFNKLHFIHQTFIYGFDSDERQIYISDFYDNGKYARKEVSYDEINKSIENIDYFINLYKYVAFDYKINLKLLKLSIEDYINCRDSLKKFEFSCAAYNKDILYGLDFYNYLIDTFGQEDYIDKRPFHLLYDHKIMMKLRLEYLEKINVFDLEKICRLKTKNEALINESKNLRILVLKYKIKRNDNLLQKIKDRLKSLKESDCELFTDILDCISI